jgi:hypothetical protein
MMIEPSESAFDNPTSWQNSEALLVVGTQDNFKTNAAIFSNPLQELTAVAAVHPDETQLLAGAAQASEQETGAIAVLDRGCRNNHRQQQPHGVNQDVPLRTIDLLACVIPSGATERCRLHTLAVQAASRWMLVTPVLVLAPLPARCHGFVARCHHRATSESRCRRFATLGYSFGSIRHWMPPTVTYRTPLMTSRMSSVRGRPPDLASGINGWIISHWLSVRSVGYSRVLINTAYTTV